MYKTIFFIFAFCLIGCSKTEAEKANTSAQMTEIKVNRLGRERVKSLLKDPSSAEFRNEVAFCGEVNSKNSFGAYTGFQKYIAANDNAVMLEENMHSVKFSKLWDELCISYAK